MCGHVGVMANAINMKQKNFFEQALYVDALRGLHATGVAAIGKGAGVNVFKKSVEASTFLDLKSYDKLYSKGTIRFETLMGHNRHATKGALSDQNAHPFTHGDITLAHNGSLRTMYQLPDYKDFDVDSDLIAHCVNKIGIDETVKKLNGSFSLVFYDKSNNTMNFIRNSERPMFIGKVKDQNTLLYASEEWMITGLSGRKYIEMEIEWVFETKVGFLYTYDMSDKEFATKPNIRQLELYSFHQYNHGAGGKKQKERGGGNKEGNVASIEDKRKEKNGKIKEEHLLESLGLKKGDIIEFEPNEFDGYEGGAASTGNLSGTLLAEPFCNVVAYALHMPDQRVMQRGMRAEIYSIINEEAKDPSDHTIIVVPSTIEVMPEAEDMSDFDDKIDDDLYLRGPRGIYISKDTYDELTKEGCANCSGDIFDSEHEDLLWTQANQPICKHCQDEKIINEGFNFMH